MIAVLDSDKRYGQEPSRHAAAMRPTAFDLLTSFFFALILMLTTMVALLFLIWLLNAATVQSDRAIHNTTVVSAGTIGIEQQDFQVPKAKEIVVLLEPTLPELIDQVSTISASMVPSHPDSDAVKGQGNNDKRVGPDGDGESDIGSDMVPPSQRWELVFEAANRAAYAGQLDHFGIELGVFGGGPGLDYAANLASGPNSRHSDQPSSERRLYFSWIRPTPLARYEQQLLAQAKIPTEGRQIVKFIPGKLEKQLTVIELEYAHSQGVSSISAIAKTVFRSEGAAGDYQFRVVRQRYRKPR